VDARSSRAMEGPHNALLVRLLLALPGASALSASYSELRRRRQDPTAPPDATADLLWRLLAWGFGVGVGAPIVATLVLSLLPAWMVNVVAAAMIGGVLTTFTSAFALGWHQGGRR